MAFLDVLASDITQIGKADFTVNLAAANQEVSVNGAGALPGLLFSDQFNGAPLDAYFEPRDKLKLKNIWCNIPHGIRQARGTHFVDLVYDQNGAISQIVEFGEGQSLIMPTTCDAIPFPPDGLVIDPAASGLASATRFRIRLRSFALKVSMAGLPSTLSAVVIPVQYHLQIFHTKALQAIP